MNDTPKMNEVLTQMMFVRNFLRSVWFVAGVALSFFIVARNLPASGILTASARTAQPSGFIGGFTPLDRARPIEDGGLWYSDIVNEPVYFHVAAPSLYGTARVELRYKNHGQPYLALGARTDLDAWSFDLKPIDLPALDESGWKARQDGDLRIYEKKPTVRSAQDILGSSSGRVAVLAVDPARWGLRLPSGKETSFESTLSLPGSRSLYVYVQEGPLDVSLGFRGPASATARIDVRRGDETLMSRTRQADGTVDLTLTGAVPGLYRVDIVAPDAMFLSGIRSRHARVALIEAEGARLRFPPGSTRFDPEFPIYTWETDLSTAQYDAIVARYSPPSIDSDGWRTASATFSLKDLAVSNGRVQMLVSAPKIRDLGAGVRVDSVGVDYVDPVFEVNKMFSFLKPGI